MPPQKHALAPRAALRSPRPAATGALALALAALLAHSGCASQSSVRDDIRSVVANRSETLGGDSLEPSIDFASPTAFDRRGQADERPASINPAASELTYAVARPDRDVARALEQYAQTSDAIAVPIDLTTAWTIAQNSAREYISAEESYILDSIRLLIERHLWGPRFFADTALSVIGSTDGGQDTALSIINTLRVTQRLPYGGEVEARGVWAATEQLRATATEDYVESTDLILSGNIPLLRGAGLVARESLIQAERDLVYGARDFEQFRRDFLVDIASDYFNLVNQQNSIRNTIRSIESLSLERDRVDAQVQAGRVKAFQTRQTQQSILDRQSSLISLQENYRVSVDRFKIRLGLPVETPVLIIPMEINPPEPEATPYEASLLALTYRLDLQNQRDRLDDSRRAVANARNDILPDLDLSGTATFGNNALDNVSDLDLNIDDVDFVTALNFSWPLDRKIEQLNLRSAIIDMQRAVRDFEVFRDNIILDARAARREIDRLRFSYQLAEQRVEDNRLTITELDLRGGAVDSFDRTRAEDNLLESENDRDQAEQDLRTAVLEYLLATGTLRVSRDGRFLPLPGMVGEGLPPILPDQPDLPPANDIPLEGAFAPAGGPAAPNPGDAPAIDPNAGVHPPPQPPPPPAREEPPADPTDSPGATVG